MNVCEARLIIELRKAGYTYSAIAEVYWPKPVYAHGKTGDGKELVIRAVRFLGCREDEHSDDFIERYDRGDELFHKV